MRAARAAITRAGVRDPRTSPCQQELLELQRLLAGQALDGAGRMTLAVALQWLRDRAVEEVP